MFLAQHQARAAWSEPETGPAALSGGLARPTPSRQMRRAGNCIARLPANPLRAARRGRR